MRSERWEKGKKKGVGREEKKVEERSKDREEGRRVEDRRKKIINFGLASEREITQFQSTVGLKERINP